MGAVKQGILEIPTARAFRPMLESSRYKAAYGGRGSAKCLGKGTKVIMYDGTLQVVENIEVGDQLLGIDGKPRTVMDITSGFDELYEVQQLTGQNYVANGAHVLALEQSKTSIQEGRYREHANGLITVADYFTKSERFKAHFFGYKRMGYFHSSEQILDAYFLGLWLGDGDSARPAITTADPEIVEYLTEFAEQNECRLAKRDPTDKPDSKASNYLVARLNGTVQENTITAKLRALNVLNNKHVPLAYRVASETQRLALLAGFLDTDGHAHCNYYAVAQCDANYALLRDIKFIADSLGFKTSIRSYVATCNGKDHPAWRFSIGGDLWRIPCKIARKRIVQNDCSKNKDWRRTRVDVIPIGLGEFYGFTIDGDHLFFLEDFTITHNSNFFAELAVERCILKPGTRGVCVREVQRSLKQSVKRLIEDKIDHYGLQHKFRKLNDSIVTPGGGVILFQGMQDHTAESIKSLEGFDFAYAEEAHVLTARSLELLRPTIRKEGSELWFAWNPRHASDPVDQLFRGPQAPPDAVIVRVSWRDNPWFPHELELERAYDETHRPDRYGHIWEGEYEPQAVGALWNRAAIHRNRRTEAPPLKRILVNIDPPIASPNMDKQTEIAEAGITVTALGDDGRGYLLDDMSIRGTPQQWAEKAVAAYDLYEADAIVAEVNQGGEMVKHVIHSVRPGLKIIMVRATRGKHVRAEPIAALYDLDRISHVGAFPELEGQLCLFTADGYQGAASPDRADSAIWGFTELFPKLIRRETPRHTPLPTRANSKYNVRRRFT